MKQVLCATLIVAATAAYVHAAATGQKSEERYTSKYNNFDVDAVLNNTKILKSYVRCVLGEGPCTNEGRELAKIVPDAIKTECAKCDEKQKSTSLKVMKHLNKNHPDLLEKLMKKFDPKGEHEKKLREQIRRAEAAATGAPSSTAAPAVPASSPTKNVGETTGKPVTKLETKIDSKPAAAAAATTSSSAKTETKVDSKPTADPTKTEIKPETITKLEAKPVTAEKAKPADIKKPESR